MIKLIVFNNANLFFYTMTCLCLVINCKAATYYVVPSNSAAANPYTNWGIAGTNIIDVVKCAMTNAAPRTVYVSNGTYYLTNQVAITNALTLQSVNGRDVTIVDGNYPNVTNRCFNISKGAILDGFTVRDGYIINSAGGGIYAATGTVLNCRIMSNTSTNLAGVYGSWGGGIYVNDGIISNCYILGNLGGGELGGGIFAEGTSSVINCIIASNSVSTALSPRYTYGCGITARGNVVIDRCTIYKNIDANLNGMGGGVYMERNTILRNSLVYANRSQRGGGIAVSVAADSGYNCKIQNCIVISNVADNNGGGIRLDCYFPNTVDVENVISYFNYNDYGSSNILWSSATGFYYIVNSCIAPTSALPLSSGGYYYTGNIQSDPKFVNKDSNDFHLAQGSPCINSGTNEDWMTGAVDLDGHSRIDRFSGVVDMGCYEYLPAGTMYSVP